MASGYVRQSTSTIVAGLPLKAANHNNEFNAIEAAMSAATGHTHDGTTGGGAPVQSEIVRSAKTANYTVIASDLGTLIDCTANSFTLTLTAAATLTDGYHFYALNSGSGIITIDGNASETINGTTTITLRQYQAAHLHCDGSNWKAVTIPLEDLLRQGKTANYTVIGSDVGSIIDCTANSFTVTLTAAATLGDGFYVWVKNSGSGTTITVDPNASETIDGSATSLSLTAGQVVGLLCNGSNWLSFQPIPATQTEVNTGTDKAKHVTPETLTGRAVLQGIHEFFVGVGAMVPRTTNGAATGTSESSSNKIMTRTLDFDQTTQEFAQFTLVMPKSWDEGTVTFIPYWTCSAGSAADTVVWALQGVALSNDDAIDTAFGTEQTSSDAVIATGDIHVGPESSAITIAGTPVAGDLIVFQAKRVPASDNLAQDAKLIGVIVRATLNVGNDA